MSEEMTVKQRLASKTYVAVGSSEKEVNTEPGTELQEVSWVKLVDEFTRLGIMMKTGMTSEGGSIYHLTPIGREFFNAHPTPDDFCKALDRLAHPLVPLQQTPLRWGYKGDSSKDGGRTMSDGISVEQWLAIRKEEALKIDANTAEIDWCYCYAPDPYGVEPDLTADCEEVKQAYFARCPGSSVWVWFGDLPEKVAHELWRRLKSS